jgi:regulator of sirC expression with transglutaminase-like and TPR domain
MPERRHLPFLLTLLEDDSDAVRAQVLAELRGFGTELGILAAPYRKGLGQEAQHCLDALCRELEQSRFSSSWLEWLNVADPGEALETALTHLAAFEFGRLAYRLSERLDDLAARLIARLPATRPETLMKGIFQKEKFQTLSSSPPNPLHDNLLYLLHHRQGSALSLSCLALLLGRRMNLSLQIVCIQGNCMVMAAEGESVQMYNMLNKGKTLARASMMYIEEAIRRDCSSPADIPARPQEIVMMILEQAIAAHRQKGRYLEAREYLEAQAQLQEELKARGIAS